MLTKKQATFFRNEMGAHFDFMLTWTWYCIWFVLEIIRYYEDLFFSI